MRAFLAGLLFAGAFVGSADAQVFGLKGGQSLETISSATLLPGDEPYVFAIKPPKPDPRFTTYKAMIYPKVGLCTVNAYLAPPAETGVAGAKDAMRRQVGLAAELDKAYGAAVDEEYGDGDGPREADLAAGSVTVIRAYDREGHKLPKGLDRVALFMQAEDGVPQLFVSYDFPDQDSCLDARNAAIDAAAPPQ